MGRPARWVLLTVAVTVAAACGPEPPAHGPPSQVTAPAAVPRPTVPSSAAAPTTTSTTAAPCAAAVAGWPLDDRLEQLLMVSGDFSDLGASAPAASAGVGAFVLFGAPPAGAGRVIASGLAALVSDRKSTRLNSS